MSVLFQEKIYPYVDNTTKMDAPDRLFLVYPMGGVPQISPLTLTPTE